MGPADFRMNSKLMMHGFSMAVSHLEDGNPPSISFVVFRGLSWYISEGSGANSGSHLLVEVERGRRGMGGVQVVTGTGGPARAGSPGALVATTAEPTTSGFWSGPPLLHQRVAELWDSPWNPHPHLCHNLCW